MLVPDSCFILRRHAAEVRALVVGRRLPSQDIRMRFSVMCFLYTVAAAVAATHCGERGVSASEAKPLVPLIDGQRRLEATSEGRRRHTSPLTGRGPVNERHTVDAEATGCIGEGNAGRNRQMTEKQEAQPSSRLLQGKRKRRKKDITDGRPTHGSSRTRRSTSTSSPRATLSHGVNGASENQLDDHSGDRKKKRKRAEVEGSGGGDRKATDDAVEEGKGESARRASGQEPSQSFTTDQNTVDVEHNEDERTAPGTVGRAQTRTFGEGGSTQDTGAPTTTIGLWTAAFSDIPLTREQRLELLLDYSVSPVKNVSERDTKEESASRAHPTKTTIGTGGHSGTEETSSNERKKLRRGRHAATSKLLAAARRPSRPPWKEPTGRTFKTQRVHAAAVGGAVLATVAFLLKVQSHEGPVKMRVDPSKHSPQYFALKDWADQRRSAFDLQAGVLQL